MQFMQFSAIFALSAVLTTSVPRGTYCGVQAGML